MGRDPKKRDNYRGDAISVNRVLRAIEQDPSCSPDWKAAATKALLEAFHLLMVDHRRPLSESFPLRKAG
jgi:hypothetical protein